MKLKHHMINNKMGYNVNGLKYKAGEIYPTALFHHLDNNWYRPFNVHNIMTQQVRNENS